MLNKYGFHENETLTNLININGLTKTNKGLEKDGKLVFINPKGGNTARLIAMWNFFKHFNDFCLGEKIEAIINSRKNGWFGQYLGSTANIFGAVIINGIEYHVIRNMEADCLWFWCVKNIDNGACVYLEDQHDLGGIKEIPEVQIKKGATYEVINGEFKGEVGELVHIYLSVGMYFLKTGEVTKISVTKNQIKMIDYK